MSENSFSHPLSRVEGLTTCTGRGRWITVVGRWITTIISWLSSRSRISSGCGNWELPLGIFEEDSTVVILSDLRFVLENNAASVVLLRRSSHTRTRSSSGSGRVMPFITNFSCLVVRTSRSSIHTSLNKFFIETKIKISYLILHGCMTSWELSFESLFFVISQAINCLW